MTFEVPRGATVIGVVEAHALAVLTAVVLWFLVTHHTGRFGHVVALIAHAIAKVSRRRVFIAIVNAAYAVREVNATPTTGTAHRTHASPRRNGISMRCYRTLLARARRSGES